MRRLVLTVRMPTGTPQRGAVHARTAEPEADRPGLGRGRDPVLFGGKTLIAPATSSETVLSACKGFDSSRRTTIATRFYPISPT